MGPALNLRLSRLDAALLLAVLTAFLVGSSLDWAWLHPGYAAYDEEGLLAQVQLLREGGGLHWTLGDGSLYRALAGASVALFGPSLAAIHGATLALLAAETLLLLAWGARLGQPRLGAWAVFINLASAHTWVRARSMLSFTAVPFELLLALWLLPARGAGPRRAAWTGAALSVLALDYELWFFGLPLLFLAWWAWQRPTRAELLAGLTAGLAGLAVLGWLSGFDPASYWQVRSSGTLNTLGRWDALVEGLGSLVRPQPDVLPFLGAQGVAWAPLWLWALALLGFVRAPNAWRWAWVFIPLALVPVLLGASAREPQRLLLAWPLLCLAGAYGALSLAQGGAWRSALIAGVLALAAWPAWGAFQRSQDAGSLRTYGLAANRLAAVRALQQAQAQGPLEVLSDLDMNSGPLLRFHLDAAGIRSQAGGAVVVPAAWDFFPQGWDPAWGRWLVVAAVPEVPELAWLMPAASRVDGLRADAAILGPYWKAALQARGAAQNRAAAEEALKQGPGPWARSVLALRYLSACRDLGELPEAPLRGFLQAPLLGGAAHYEAADFVPFRDPPRALSLADEALRRDPRRLEAWELKAALLRAQGREEAASATESQLRARQAGSKRP